MRNKYSHGGFSLVEVVSVIAVLGVLASLSISIVGRISQNTRTEKLSSDTKTLNRAVMAYRASGGSLDSVNTASEVLTKLRTQATSAAAKRIPGLSSSFIDPRIALRVQSTAEAASNSPRVYWDNTTQHFFVAFSGSESGVKEFYLDDTIAEVNGGTEGRESPLLYAATDGWIWDYADVALPSGPNGPTPVTVTPVNPTTTPATPQPPLPPVPPSVLQPPIFSLSGGAYSINVFELNISLADPNPAGASELYYAVNYGEWQKYSGPFITQPDDVISAQAIAISNNYSDSSKTDQVYTAEPAPLSPPIINSSQNDFGLFFNRTLTVDLVDTNKPDISETRYRLNSGPWLPYSSSFELNRDDYPGGVTIEAQAVSSGSSYYLSSMVSERMVGLEGLDVNGVTLGSFQNPQGSSDMVTNLAPGNSSSYFEWGEDYYPQDPDLNLSKSTLEYTGASFGNVTVGERFQIGNLDYYNGRVLGGTGADAIGLNIDLSLNINGNVFNPNFDFSFDLINTANQGDPDNPWPDADYVLLTDPVANSTLIINDYEYEFRIEFGETTTDGFSLFDEFHVLEQKSAAVNIYGTFVEIGQISF